MEIKDVQGRKDMRNIAISNVGITNVGYQGYINSQEIVIPIYGKCSCLSSLSSEKRGTHMSRMARVIQKIIGNKLCPSAISDSLLELRELLGDEDLTLLFEAEGLRKKQAPITKLEGYEPFKLIIEGKYIAGEITILAKVIIIATSLCPASKENSALGAHNQRSEITVEIPFLETSDLILCMEILETCASSPVYPILKLEDESYVTEKAYENPGFVEDIVRNCAVTLEKNKQPYRFISCENFESIHTHNAYACIHIAHENI